MGNTCSADRSPGTSQRELSSSATPQHVPRKSAAARYRSDGKHRNSRCSADPVFSSMMSSNMSGGVAGEEDSLTNSLRAAGASSANRRRSPSREDSRAIANAANNSQGASNQMRRLAKYKLSLESDDQLDSQDLTTTLHSPSHPNVTSQPASFRSDGGGCHRPSTTSFHSAPNSTGNGKNTNNNTTANTAASPSGRPSACEGRAGDINDRFRDFDGEEQILSPHTANTGGGEGHNGHQLQNISNTNRGGSCCSPRNILTVDAEGLFDFEAEKGQASDHHVNYLRNKKSTRSSEDLLGKSTGKGCYTADLENEQLGSQELMHAWLDHQVDTRVKRSSIVANDGEVVKECRLVAKKGSVDKVGAKSEHHRNANVIPTTVAPTTTATVTKSTTKPASSSTNRNSSQGEGVHNTTTTTSTIRRASDVVTPPGEGGQGLVGLLKRVTSGSSRRMM